MEVIKITHKLYNKNKPLFALNALGVVGVLSPLLSLFGLLIYFLSQEDLKHSERDLFNRVFNFWLLFFTLNTALSVASIIALKVELQLFEFGYSSVLMNLVLAINYLSILVCILNVILFFKEKQTIYPEFKFLKLDAYSMFQNAFAQVEKPKH